MTALLNGEALLLMNSTRARVSEVSGRERAMSCSAQGGALVTGG